MLANPSGGPVLPQDVIEFLQRPVPAHLGISSNLYQEILDVFKTDPDIPGTMQQAVIEHAREGKPDKLNSLMGVYRTLKRMGVGENAPPGSPRLPPPRVTRANTGALQLPRGTSLRSTVAPPPQPAVPRNVMKDLRQWREETGKWLAAHAKKSMDGVTTWSNSVHDAVKQNDFYLAASFLLLVPVAALIIYCMLASLIYVFGMLYSAEPSMASLPTMKQASTARNITVAGHNQSLEALFSRVEELEARVGVLSRYKAGSPLMQRGRHQNLLDGIFRNKHARPRFSNVSHTLFSAVAMIHLPGERKNPPSFTVADKAPTPVTGKEVSVVVDPRVEQLEDRVKSMGSQLEIMGSQLENMGSQAPIIVVDPRVEELDDRVKSMASQLQTLTPVPPANSELETLKNEVAELGRQLKLVIEANNKLEKEVAIVTHWNEQATVLNGVLVITVIVSTTLFIGAMATPAVAAAASQATGVSGVFAQAISGVIGAVTDFCSFLVGHGAVVGTIFMAAPAS